MKRARGGASSHTLPSVPFLSRGEPSLTSQRCPSDESGEMSRWPGKAWRQWDENSHPSRFAAPIPTLPCVSPRGIPGELPGSHSEEPPAAPGWVPPSRECSPGQSTGKWGSFQRLRPHPLPPAGTGERRNRIVRAHGTFPSLEEGMPREAEPDPCCSHEPALTPHLKFFRS